MCCLHHILNIYWSEFITNVEILKQAEIPSVEAMPLKYHLQWAGHVSIMEDHHLPKISLYGELFAGHRKELKKRYKDHLKNSLTAFHVDHLCWSDMLADHYSCHNFILRAVNEFEEDRRDAQEKQKASSTCLKHHTERYLHLCTLLTVLSFPYSSRQS